MSEVPEVIRRAIEAQGAYKVEEVEEGLADVNLDKPEPPPAPEPSDEQGVLELGVSIQRDRDR